MNLVWMIISWSVFGLIVGALARFLVPGSQPMGFLGTIVLGVIGSYVGGFLGSFLFGGEVTFSNPAGWIGGLIGAVIVLLIYIQLKKKSV